MPGGLGAGRLPGPGLEPQAADPCSTHTQVRRQLLAAAGGGAAPRVDVQCPGPGQRKNAGEPLP